LLGFQAGFAADEADGASPERPWQSQRPGNLGDMTSGRARHAPAP
jgi:hypothetical protein